MKEVQQVNKETPPKKSCRSKKRKATDELIIKEYNPTRRRNEPPWRKETGVKVKGLKGDMATAEDDNKDRNLTTTPLHNNLHLDVQAATAAGPLDLRTRVREATPESGNSLFDSPGSSMHGNSPGSSLQSSPESTPSSTAMRLGSPPPLEPLPTQMTPPLCNSSKAASRRPFAEGFMWQLLSQLRQEVPKARREGKASAVPSG